ncbi:MAG: CvpA family protein [Candidatus Symbiobacter sp.]|nr:CvpA family protein [Candidatus Symbiobacter sp.]
MFDGMTKFDYILAAIILVFGLRGIARGGIGKLCDFAAWIGAGYGVIWFYPTVYKFTAAQMGHGLNAEIVTVVGLLIVLMVLLSIIGYWATHQLRQKIEIPFDRSLGFVGGVLQGAVTVMAAYIVVKWVFQMTTPPAWLGEAKIYPWLMHVSEMVMRYFPTDFR